MINFFVRYKTRVQYHCLRLIHVDTRLIKVKAPDSLWIVGYICPMNNYFDTRRTLMIGSLILLLAFLAHWNYENYNRQKDVLLSDLETQAKLTHGEKLDSTFRIVMNVFKSESDVIEDSIKIRNKGLFTEIESEYVKMKVITSEDSLQKEWTTTDILDTLMNKSSFKLKMDPDSFVIHELRELSFNRFDTSEFIKQYTRKLNNQRLPSSFRMSPDSVRSLRNDLLVELRYDQRTKERYFASFNNYRSYIFKKIWPSVLMSILLFSFVALAFYLIYRSWLEQSKLVQLKNEFVSNMTHELKTPISTMSVALEAMSDFGVLSDTAKSKEYIDISKKELQRLGIMVDKVLLMSRFESGDTIIHYEHIDLKRIIEDILSTMKLYFEKMNVEVNFNALGTDFLMEGDRIHLANVIYNMIDNSIKYSDESPRLDLSLQNLTNKLVFTIKDNGQGIPSEYLDKIFSRFFRVPTQDRHDVKGHGLGLSYVKKIVDQHHGTITVDSKEQVGTTFTINLPRKRKDV